MRASLKVSWSTVVLSALLTACGGSDGGGTGQPIAASATAQSAASSTASAVASSTATLPIESREQTSERAAIDVSPFKDRLVGHAPVPQHVILPSLPAENALPLKWASRTFGVPTKVGVARQIAQTASVEAVAAMMSWSPSERGGKQSDLPPQAQKGSASVCVSRAFPSAPWFASTATQAKKCLRCLR
jgi:hypothetical protein